MSIYKSIKFDVRGLVPAILQDYYDGTVLMVAYMDKKALRKTLRTGKATFWSRSRQTYWTKGETSGHFQLVKEVYLDCDGDCLLFKVKSLGPACHTNARSCFWRKLKNQQWKVIKVK